MGPGLENKLGETKRSQLGCEPWNEKGTESGPGETLFAALHGLQKSIYFVSNQSLLMLEILLSIISHNTTALLFVIFRILV